MNGSSCGIGNLHACVVRHGGWPGEVGFGIMSKLAARLGIGQTGTSRALKRIPGERGHVWQKGETPVAGWSTGNSPVKSACPRAGPRRRPMCAGRDFWGLKKDSEGTVRGTAGAIDMLAM